MHNTEVCDYEYITYLQYKEEELLLQEYFNNACTLSGTQRLIHLSQSVQSKDKDIFKV
jgi:hypothetical protein